MQAHFGAVENAHKLTEQLTRLLEFGRLEVDDVAEGTATRVTAIGAGTLEPEAGE